MIANYTETERQSTKCRLPKLKFYSVDIFRIANLTISVCVYESKVDNFGTRFCMRVGLLRRAENIKRTESVGCGNTFDVTHGMKYGRTGLYSHGMGPMGTAVLLVLKLLVSHGYESEIVVHFR